MKKLNIPALIFALAFLFIAVFKWPDLSTAGVIIFSLVVFGFAVMGIAPLFTNKK